ncbi:tyrosine-type recombinase/integrase [Streptomyces sp. NPDC005279]|uniref:tyrosine-type recombinase/integrase n=1 Tax=Streptomyces sp. NPDC005279 TaxID=3364712 RepID=UPI0036AB5A79
MTTTAEQVTSGAASGLATRSLAGSQTPALLAKFPHRNVASAWPETEYSYEQILGRLQKPPFRLEKKTSQQARMQGARWIMKWLSTFPGENWQQRWQACPGAADPKGWTAHIREWGRSVGGLPTHSAMTAGLLGLVCADVIRPDLAWLASRNSRYLRLAIEATRDPEGFARLRASVPADLYESHDGSRALSVLAQLMVTYGGGIRDIRVGDLLALRADSSRHRSRPIQLVYGWLRNMGQFPPDAPGTLFHLQSRALQSTPAQLVDRYHLQCQPVRDLIVDYLTERQAGLDWNSLERLSTVLGKNFWADLECHHPGISSIDLPPDVRTEYKARMATKVVRRRQPDGTLIEFTEPRASAPAVLQIIRSFYLDLAQWALDEPERWGRWAVPCPISTTDTNVTKLERQQKSRADQRTRERLPYLPVLVSTAERRLKEARERLDAVRAAPLGSTFTVLGETYVKARLTSRPDGQTETAYEVGGKRKLLGSKEKRAFWAWVTIEILRHTGIRIEELQELSHHSIIRYTLPTTGEIVPLLQIAPSKTDQERLLLISPELADVLSAVVSRVRGPDGTVPLVRRYDDHERVWSPPMPLLCQWSVSGETRAIAKNTIVRGLDKVIEDSGLRGKDGKPLRYQPHDFRRIFITDAILNGLPPHIAQVIAGHENIGTTMGYNAIYPGVAIEAHRAFIARRRAMRPPEEYRAVTSEEWDEFLGHFERRKLALGECGRAYGTDCAHEHACVRCPVLIVGPNERPRLVEIRQNLADRIAEAEREGWLGEAEGLSVSLAAAEEKISQLDGRQDRRSSQVFLGVPSFDQITSRTSTAPKPAGD